MRRKKSILIVNNLELNFNDTTDRSQEDTKRSNNPVSFKRLQKKSSFTRNRPRSISGSSQTDNPIQRISESIIVVNNSSHVTQNSEPSSEIKKRSISCMKTQDRSIISSVVRSCSKQGLQRSNSERSSCALNDRKTRVATVSDRYSSNSIDRASINANKVESRYREARKRYLDDPVPLESIINVKAIKLEENSDVSRAYLRKIIQNRVSIQHYAQNQKNYRRMRP